MKLKDKDFQPTSNGLSGSYREWWDIGDGYEIYVSIGQEVCSFGIDSPLKDITYDVATLLGVDVSEESLTKRNHEDEEIYVSMGIDCVVLNYRKPENYKQLMKKIETIVNDRFKNK
jgi:hypothetical protein